MDLNSAMGSLLGAVLTFVIFCTKEEGCPLETSTDDSCFLSAPPSVSIAKCLYDWAKRFVRKPSVMAGEKKHLPSVLASNGYPSSLVQKITKTRTIPANKRTLNPPLLYLTCKARSIGASERRTTRHSHRFQA